MLTKPDKILIAWFSRSGNTQKTADQIQVITGGDMFEIRREKAYPELYRDVLDIAKHEIQTGAKPKLKEQVNNFDQYDVIFIGFPNWWNTFPAPVLTFLTENDFTGKTVVPFCTHGGGGAGRSFIEIAKHCSEANVIEGFSINGYYADESKEKLTDWLKKLNVKSNFSAEL